MSRHPGIRGPDRRGRPSRAELAAYEAERVRHAASVGIVGVSRGRCRSCEAMLQVIAGAERCPWAAPGRAPDGEGRIHCG